MMEKTYEDLEMELSVYKQSAELAKKSIEDMRAKNVELNKEYFKIYNECSSIEKAYEVLYLGGVNLKEEYPDWFKPMNVLETKINLYELQIKVMKDRIKELEK